MISKAPKVILFIVMDTARYKSFNFESDKVNPNVNRFISNYNFLNFKRAISPAPWTIPSHVSMFTGDLPSKHGCKDYGFKVSDEIPYLPSILREKNYRTVGITSNGLLTSASNFNRGFDDYYSTWNYFQNTREFYRIKHTIAKHRVKGLLKIGSHMLRNNPLKSLSNILYRKMYSVKNDSTPSTKRTTLLAIEELQKTVDKSQNLFLFLNYMQPHMDYNPPEPYRSKFKGNFSGNISQSPIDFYSGNMSEDNLSILEKLYMGEISYLDSEVGQVIKKMEDTGLIDDSSIFIVSDHGEHIGEHNHISHYFSLYNEVVHVPLFVKLPKDSIDIGVNPDEDFVSTADIFPTICSIINHDLGDKNIYSFQEGKRAEVISELYMPSEYDYFIESCKKINPSFSKSDFVKAGMQNQKAIFFKNKKLILRKENNNELFNFRDDYSEQNNILGSSNQEEIASIIDNHMLKIARSKISVGSDKMQERLRKLGYY